MTTKSLTDEQLRIAVAQKCGWHSITKSAPCAGLYAVLWGCLPDDKATAYPTDLVPDYLHSLDAMSEARKVLTPQQVHIFTTELLKQTGATGWDSESNRPWFNIWAIANATARDHALAFLACFEDGTS